MKGKRTVGFLGFPFLFLGSLLLAACLPAGVTLPQSPWLAALERKSGLIAYAGLDGNIYTIDQGGNQQRAVTTDAQPEVDEAGNALLYLFPAWSPNSRRLAFVSLRSEGNFVGSASLFTANADGSDRVETFQSTDRFPFYLYWSPNGEYLTFLTAIELEDHFALHLAPAAGGAWQVLGQGSPVYWAWSPDNQAVAIHSGGTDPNTSEDRLARVELGEAVGDALDEQELALEPTLFQSPSWSPAGDELLLAARTEDDEQALLLTDLHGQVKRVVDTVDGPVGFGWSPDGERIAFVVTRLESQDVSARRLIVVNSAAPNGEVVAEEGGVAGFFWSPDTRRIAYFVPSVVAPEETAQGQPAEPVLILSLYTMDANTGKSRQVFSFQPTEQFVNLLRLFDQYQHSATIWSPDSRHLVVASLDPEGVPKILVAEASGSLQPRAIAEGQLAFWSWK